LQLVKIIYTVPEIRPRFMIPKTLPLFLLSLLALPGAAFASEPSTGTLIQLSGLGMLVIGASSQILVSLFRKKSQ